MSEAHTMNREVPAAITCNPRFMLGVKSDVQNAIFYIDDNITCYVSGHNIVFYNSNDKSQRFIPGIEGTETINCINMNPTRRLLAVCETATQAICSIYNITKIVESMKDRKGSGQPVDSSIIKKRKILVMPDSEATQFISAEFCPQNDKIIATLSGSPDFRIQLWQWDK